MNILIKNKIKSLTFVGGFLLWKKWGEAMSYREKEICNHNYEVLDSEVTKMYGDNQVYQTVIDAVMYCSKCLDVLAINGNIKGVMKWLYA